MADYARFEREGREAWDRVDALLQLPVARLDYASLEELARLHRQVVSDYGFARRHFADTDVSRRLGVLAFQGHQALSPPEPALWRRVLRFATVGYREVFQSSLPALASSWSLFGIGVLLGGVIAWVEPTFGRIIFGPEAYAQLAGGEIWTDAIGGSVPGSVLSSKIATNNMSVALLAWSGGALVGSLTVYLLLFNGVMVGSLLALALHFDLLDNVLAWTAAHGPLELFLITVAGGAGLELSRGLVVRDHRPRGEVFAAHARKSVQLMLGTLPGFLVLGGVEGFVSPDMEVPVLYKGMLGLLLLAGFIGFAMLPVRGSLPDRRNG